MSRRMAARCSESVLGVGAGWLMVVKSRRQRRRRMRRVVEGG